MQHKGKVQITQKTRNQNPNTLMGETQEETLEEMLENITERRSEADGWQYKLTRNSWRTKTKYTDTLTRGSGTGEVSEGGKGQVR